MDSLADSATLATYSRLAKAAGVLPSHDNTAPEVVLVHALAVATNRLRAGASVAAAFVQAADGMPGNRYDVAHLDALLAGLLNAVASGGETPAVDGLNCEALVCEVRTISGVATWMH